MNNAATALAFFLIYSPFFLDLRSFGVDLCFGRNGGRPTLLVCHLATEVASSENPFHLTSPTSSFKVSYYL